MPERRRAADRLSANGSLAAFVVSCALAMFTEAAWPQEPIKSLPPPASTVEPATPAERLTTPADDQQSGPPRWITGVRLGTGYDSNVPLAPTTQIDSGDFTGELRASALGQFAIRDWRLGVEGDGGALVHGRLNDYDTFVFRGGLSASGSVSRRTRLRTAHSYFYDYIRDFTPLSDAGLATNQVILSSYDGTVDITHDLKPRLAILADAEYARNSYSDDALPEGDTIIGKLGLAWRSRPTETLTFRYVYERPRSDDLTGWTSGGRMIYERRLSTRAAAEVSLGAGRSRPLGRSETVTPWLAGAQLNGHFGTHQLVGAFRHAIDQAYGYGRSLIFDSIWLEDHKDWTPRWRTSVRGSLGKGHEPAGADFEVAGRNLQAGVNYRATPRVSTRLTFIHQRSRDTTRGTAISNSLVLWLVYERPWR